MNPDNAKNSMELLKLILGFFPRVDTRLSVIFAVNTGMLAILVTNAPGIKEFTWLSGTPFVATIICLTVSIVFWYRATFPQLKGGHASLVYFKEIAKRTEQKFIDEFKQQTEEQWLHDVLGQTWRNSEILTAKFKALKISFIFLAVALIPWATALALFVNLGSRDGLIK